MIFASQIVKPEFTSVLTIVCGGWVARCLDLCILRLATELASEILNRFGSKVRGLRKDLGFSQEELAERANLHRTYIGMIERAEKNITLLNIERLANALDVSVSQLLEDN